MMVVLLASFPSAAEKEAKKKMKKKTRPACPLKTCLSMI